MHSTSYLTNFPPLHNARPQSHSLFASGSKMDGIDKELMKIMQESTTPVQLVRPQYPSPAAIRTKVVGLITGWNPQISLSDRAKYEYAFNAYQRANVAFDTTGKLGEFPPLMDY